MDEKAIKHRRQVITHYRKVAEWAPAKVKEAYAALADRLEVELTAKLQEE